jgi:hypothetical protein
LDLGANRFETVDAVGPIFELTTLHSLNLQKNPISGDYSEIVLDQLPNLIVLDSKRIKQKRSHFAPDHPKYAETQEQIQKNKADRKRADRKEKLRILKEAVEQTGRTFHRHIPRYKAIEKRKEERASKTSRSKSV